LFEVDLAPAGGLAGDGDDGLDVVVGGQFLAFERDEEGAKHPHDFLEREADEGGGERAAKDDGQAREVDEHPGAVGGKIGGEA